jgi:ketosteroid isomerase-like protein
MSEENVERVKRGAEAVRRGDIEAQLEDLDPDVEWTPAFPVLLGGGTRVYRGHEGVREMFRGFYETIDEIHAEYSEFHDLGDRIVAIGRIRTRGKESGATTESPFALVADFKDGKTVRVLTYLDPQEALEAAGLSE